MKYEFKPKNYPLITSWLVEYILRHGEGKLRITLDLGITYVNAEVRRGFLNVGNWCISIESLRSIRDDNTVYLLVNSKLIPIRFYDETLRRFYKLRAIAMDKAPTLEINGIHMHRIEGIDPWQDALLKIRSLGSLKNAQVLDTCTGLGYTAIASLRAGASKVVTIEVDANVLKIAEFNSWSRDLSKVDVVLGDVTKVIKEFDDESFTHIIHDPPRYELAGELYSLEFYKDLYRVLGRGGKLFHYVGRPGWKRGVNIVKGVKNRLLMAGFNIIRWIEDAQGFIAIKARY